MGPVLAVPLAIGAAVEAGAVAVGVGAATAAAIGTGTAIVAGTYGAILIVGIGVAVTIEVFERLGELVANCPCCDGPSNVPDGIVVRPPDPSSSRCSSSEPAEAREFNRKLRQASDVEAHSPTVFSLEGTRVANSMVPYKFRAVMARYKGSYFHVGLLIEAKFTIEGHTFSFALLERFNKYLSVRFFQSSQEAREPFKTLKLNGNPYEDMTETVVFESRTPASELAKFFQEDIKKKAWYSKDRTECKEALRDENKTNCTFFAIRAGASCLGGGEGFAKQLIDSMENLN